MAQRCALLWSCVTRSRNLFCVFAIFVVRDLRLRFELRNLQPQFVFCFCDFLDVNLQDFVLKFFAEEIEFILVLAHSHFLSRKTRFNTHHFDADVAISFEAGLKCGGPPILRACADPPETTNLQERYFCGAAIQCQSKLLAA